MKTFSAVTRTSNQTEALLRASINDVVEHQGDNWADAIRAAYPLPRIFSYQIYRTITPATAAEWIAFAGGGAESGFLHIGGFDSAHRRKNPSTGTPGNSATYWYPMNMGHAAYVNWQHSNTLKVFQGIRYGAPQFTFPPALDAVVMDVALWYSNYDDINNDGIILTDEYSGTGELYRTHCLNAFTGLQAYMAASSVPQGLVYPNFGGLIETLRIDADTASLTAAATRLIAVEEAVHWEVGEPTAPAEFCEQRWGKIATLLDGTRELMLDGWVDEGESQANRNIAKIGFAAWCLMADEPGLVARYYQGPDDQADPIQTWEDNSLLQSATDILGAPLGPYTILPGGTNKRTYQRMFESGRVLLSVRKIAQVGSEPVVVSFGSPLYPLDVDGSWDAAVGSITLNIGEGAILWNGVNMALTIVATPGAATANSYLTPAEADTLFFADTNFEPWDRLSTMDKYRHMIRATREVDAEMIGVVKNDETLTAGVPNQALMIPRAIDKQNNTLYIPDAIKKATFEQIGANIQGSAAGFRQDLRSQGVVEIELGDGTREKYSDGSGSGGSGGVLSSRARDILISGGFIELSTGWQ